MASSMGSTEEQWDVIVLGSGEGGKYLAWSLASSGKRVALIEREWVGGSCPNIACLPSKNLLYSAHMAYLAQKGATSGVFSADVSKIDLTVARQRKRDMVDGLVQMHQDRFKQSGAQLVIGEGHFVADKVISVQTKDGSTRRLRGEVAIISTGSKAQIDDRISGLKEANPLTHIEMLEVDEIPKHLIILGGGYVGLEFAQAMRRFGSEVTVIERNSRILKKEDEDVSVALMEILASEGIRFLTNTSVDEISGYSGKSVLVKTSTLSGKPREVTGSHVLCATGRVPNTANIGLEDAGIALTASGHIQVNEHLQTSVPGVFAVGDCAGSPHFTHIAYDDFRIVRSFLSNLSPSARSTINRQVPYTLFTSPEIAHIGLHEHEAQAQGIQYRLAKLPMKAFLRTRTMDETAGFAKALVSTEEEGNKILGFTALGAGAGELLPAVQVAMSAGLPYTTLSGLVITHPTMAEGLVYLFSAVPVGVVSTVGKT